MTHPVSNFDELLARVRTLPKRTVAVACGDMASVIAACRQAEDADVAETILVGDEARTRELAAQAGIDSAPFEFVDVPDPDEAALAAVRLVSGGRAHCVMKGRLHTDDFLRAVLAREGGLRTKRLLSHVFILEIRGPSAVSEGDRLLLVTDGAMNIAPDFEAKAQIARNAIEVALSLGVEQPKVAALAAVELVNPKMPATQDAAILSHMSYRGQFEHGVVEGPFALDNAVSERAAREKGIDNPVAGKADVLLVPDVEAGNILVKSFVYFAGGRIAGVLLGASAPVVLTSRADTAESKFLSIATAVYLAGMGESRVKVGRRL